MAILCWAAKNSLCSTATKLLVLFLVGILRMLLDIVIRAIAVVRIRGCGLWLSLLGHSVPGGSVTCLVGDGQGPHHRQDGHLPDDRRGCAAPYGGLRGAEAEIEEVDRPSAPKKQLNNLDRLVNWSNEFLGRRDTDRVYPVPIIRNEQDVVGNSTTDLNVENENSKGGKPKH